MKIKLIMYLLNVMKIVKDVIVLLQMLVMNAELVMYYMKELVKEIVDFILKFHLKIQH